MIIATLPSSGAFFTTYEGVKHVLIVKNPKLARSQDEPTGLLPQPMIHATASATAELVSCAILTPAEVIKQNAQMADSPRQGNVNATLQAVSKFRSNPLGLWRGYAALAGRNLPFTAMQFPLFEHLKRLMEEARERSGKGTRTLLESGLITAASAGLAGSVAAVITTPIDVVKTRIMLAAAAENASQQKPAEKSVVTSLKHGGEEGLVDAMGHAIRNKPSRKSSLQIGREVVMEQGIKGLWRGGALRALWTMLGSGLYLGTYESGRLYLARGRGVQLNENDLL